MSIMIRVRVCSVAMVIVAGACAADEGGAETQGDGSSTMGGVSTPTTTRGAETSGSSSGIGEAASTDPTTADGSSTDDGQGDESSTADGSSGSDSGGALEYDPEFVWVADFLRVNCSGCHATDSNGNLVLPNADIDNEQVRLALEGVVATTGLMLVEPGDHQASQTWLQITNEFGAVFPVEDTDRFGAWIDAGAPYYVE